MIWLFIGGLVIPWIFYFFDLLGNNFDSHFSSKTLKRLTVSKTSFLRRVIPLQEGDIVRKGQICGHRYYLYPRVLAVFIQSLIETATLLLKCLQRNNR